MAEQETLPSDPVGALRQPPSVTGWSGAGGVRPDQRAPAALLDREGIAQRNPTPLLRGAHGANPDLEFPQSTGVAP
jgi:hypothetical protein